MYRSTQLDIQFCQTIDGKVLLESWLKEKMRENIPKGNWILTEWAIAPGNFAQLALKQRDLRQKMFGLKCSHNNSAIPKSCLQLS